MSACPPKKLPRIADKLRAGFVPPKHWCFCGRPTAALEGHLTVCSDCAKHTNPVNTTMQHLIVRGI